MPFDKIDIDSITEERRKSVAKSIRAASIEELKKLGDEVFHDLRWDLIAGLITAAVVIPKAMAYATIAGLPVQVGLHTVLVPMAIYAVVGTSRPLSVSTTTTLAILAAAALGHIAATGDSASLMRASATLTLLVGVILLLASLVG